MKGQIQRDQTTSFNIRTPTLKQQLQPFQIFVCLVS